MARSEDIKGERFGRLTAIEIDHEASKRMTYWKCICDCGNKVVVTRGNLTSGQTKSCGCYHLDRIQETFVKHGCARKNKKTREYNIWKTMMQRCYNKNNPNYHQYGGRGIGICKEWKESFEKFFEDMGSCPDRNHSIDRIDNNKGYSKTNCRWATQKQQVVNSKRSIQIEYQGTIDSITGWAKKLNVSIRFIKIRLDKGASIDKIIEESKRYKKYKQFK